MTGGFYFILDGFPTILENLTDRKTLPRRDHDPDLHQVSRTAVPTTTSLPDFRPWSQEHKSLNSLLTCDFNMQQLSKGLETDQNQVHKSMKDLMIPSRHTRFLKFK